MINPNNHLLGETSPYLLQHVDNPVEWFPWNEEALEKARGDRKPILLSVGYSACHWCHVMAHESFEDSATANLMNQFFVNIKVDREERPDLDKIYQISHQLLTGQAGGWPLTMFLTPDDLAPFFGGTYFPIRPRLGKPGFKEVLVRVAEFFASNQDDISRQNQTLINTIKNIDPINAEGILSAQPLNRACAKLNQIYDRQHGGFGSAPKFPMPTNLERLLRHYALTGDTSNRSDNILRLVNHTLTRMGEGGLYDHVGGGFYRYSVDDEWMIPHFEKMLYDNGPLLGLYADHAKLTESSTSKHIVRGTAAWVIREMQSRNGSYYSSLDADSAGGEGKYYVWSKDEVATLLDEDEFNICSKKFGLDRAPNFEDKNWHLHTYRSDHEIAAITGHSQSDISAGLRRAKQKLFMAREKRVRPSLDDKCLTSWNALMIKGMINAGVLCREPRFIDSAVRSLDFIKDSMWKGNRLLSTSRGSKGHSPAYLDDYAFLIDAILALAQTRWRISDIDFAVLLADVMLNEFEDVEKGGFYFTSHSHEKLFYRPKPLMDDALPAGNGIAAFALARLGHLLGETRYLEATERTLQLANSAMSKIPHAHNALLLGLEEYLEPPQIIILRGNRQALIPWQTRAQQFYAPKRLCFGIPSEEIGLPAILASHRPSNEFIVTAHICEGQHCKASISDFDEFEKQLSETEVNLNNTASRNPQNS